MARHPFAAVNLISDPVHGYLELTKRLSRAESANLVERVLHHMCHALAKGTNVKVSGFGTFILRDKGQRVGRNPKTGDKVDVPPKKVPYFKPGKELKELINKEPTPAPGTVVPPDAMAV